MKVSAQHRNLIILFAILGVGFLGLAIYFSIDYNNLVESLGTSIGFSYLDVILVMICFYVLSLAFAGAIANILVVYARLRREGITGDNTQK